MGFNPLSLLGLAGTSMIAKNQAADKQEDFVEKQRKQQEDSINKQNKEARRAALSRAIGADVPRKALQNPLPLKAPDISTEMQIAGIADLLTSAFTNLATQGAIPNLPSLGSNPSATVPGAQSGQQANWYQ